MAKRLFKVHEAELGIISQYQLLDEAVHNPLQNLHDLLCQLEITVVAPVQGIPLALVEADNEVLLPVNVARSQIMVTSVSPAALIISATMPDGPAALLNFILETTFVTISMVIGMGGDLPMVVHQAGPQDPNQIPHFPAFHKVLAILSALVLQSWTSHLHHFTVACPQQHPHSPTASGW